MSQKKYIFDKIEYRAVIKYLFLKDKSSKETYDDMIETLNEACPSYSTIKSWTSNFKRGQFDLKDDAKSGRPISVTTPDKMDAIHDMIILDRRISAKKIAETL